MMPDELTGGLLDWGTPSPVVPPPQSQSEIERTNLPTETAFLNSALALCGANNISSIDDESNEAVKCKSLYPSLLDATLRMNHWKFAEGRAVLSVLQTPPLFGFSNSFALPADWLKMREFNGMALAIGMTRPEFWYHGMCVYKISGRNLLSHYGQAYILYTRRVSDPAQWDGLFYKYIQYLLASELAIAIPRDQKMSSGHLEKAQALWMPLATQVDGQEESAQPFQVDDLTWGR